jgi:hypothetical protein
MDTHLILRSPSAFTALPYELLYTIFSLLIRPDLLSQCYIRQFRTVAQDVLYREFHTDGRNVAMFLRTILLNKTLASRVRRVYMKEGYLYRDIQYPESFVALLTQVLWHLDIPSHVKELWSKQISHRRALTTLLLSRLTRLERLEITSFDDNHRLTGIPGWFLSPEQPFWTLLLPEITTSFVKAPFLRNVRELNLKGLSCSVCDLAGVLSLPSLRSLRMAPITHSQRDQGLPRSTFRPRSNGLSTLVLPDANISRQTLRQILHSCTALVDFTYGERERYAKTTHSWVNKDPDSLIKMLSPFHDTLRTLRLENQDPFPSESLPIRSLSQFTTLERFSTGTFALIDDGIDDGSQIQEILPESLVELELRDHHSRLTATHGNNFHDVIGVFAEAKRKLLPNLTKMSLTLDQEYWDISDLDLNKCLRNGIEFRIQIDELC